MRINCLAFARYRELALLSHMLNHFDQFVPRNPCSKVNKLEERNEQDRVLSRDEEELFLMAASQPLQDIAMLMLETGMRPEEVCRFGKVAKFRPYDLRYTFATRAVQAGVDLVTLAAMLGHSKINMVLRYAHPTEEHQAAAMQKIQASAAR